eukprot:scaffold349831_cov42-Prasinocladus_malaysianus.AAC.2
MAFTFILFAACCLIVEHNWEQMAWGRQFHAESPPYSMFLTMFGGPLILGCMISHTIRLWIHSLLMQYYVAELHQSR